MEDTQGKVQQLLAILGSTPLEIARNLESAGIKGVIRSCTCCPIAIYLQREGIKCSVGLDNVRILIDHVIFKIKLPSQVINFIDNFDEGIFGSLVA